MFLIHNLQERKCQEAQRSSENHSPSFRYPSTPLQFWDAKVGNMLAWETGRRWENPQKCSRECPQGSGTKKEPKPKLLSPDIFWWGGGLPREGVGAKKFGMSLETQGIKLFWRDIPGFCRDIPEAPEKFEKKMFGFNFWPLFLLAIRAPFRTTKSQTILPSESPFSGPRAASKVQCLTLGGGGSDWSVWQSERFWSQKLPNGRAKVPFLLFSFRDPCPI